MARARRGSLRRRSSSIINDEEGFEEGGASLVGVFSWLSSFFSVRCLPVLLSALPFSSLLAPHLALHRRLVYRTLIRLFTIYAVVTSGVFRSALE